MGHIFENGDDYYRCTSPDHVTNYLPCTRVAASDVATDIDRARATLSDAIEAAEHALNRLALQVTDNPTDARWNNEETEILNGLAEDMRRAIAALDGKR